MFAHPHKVVLGGFFEVIHQTNSLPLLFRNINKNVPIFQVTSQGPDRTCDPKELLERPLWKERTNIATDWPFLSPYTTQPVEGVHKRSFPEK